VALLLARRGITRIRPLAGGLGGWRERGLPLATPERPEATSTPVES
jgi:3-mercaptopyruvate sulfurtransferase SseA